jgi:hypothetical protein
MSETDYEHGEKSWKRYLIAVGSFDIKVFRSLPNLYVRD